MGRPLTLYWKAAPHTDWVGELAAPNGGAQRGKVGAPLPGGEPVLGRPEANVVRALRIHKLQRLLRRSGRIKVQLVDIAPVCRKQAGRDSAPPSSTRLCRSRTRPSLSMQYYMRSYRAADVGMAIREWADGS